MVDVCGLYGADLGERVLSLCRQVLQLQHGVRFFATAAPDTETEAQISEIISRLDGTQARTVMHSIRKRGHNDPAPVLRAPVCFYCPTDEALPHQFVRTLLSIQSRLLLSLHTPLATEFLHKQQPLWKRFYPVGIFTDHARYHAATAAAAAHAVPSRLEEQHNTETYYLSAEEKLALCWLVHFSSAARQAYFQEQQLGHVWEASRDLPAWLGPARDSRIVHSMRFQLYPFMRWYYLGTEQRKCVIPMPISPTYLPISEDNCVLSVAFGRLFSPLFCVELLFERFFVGRGILFSAAGLERNWDRLEEAHFPTLLTLLLYVYYRCLCMLFDEDATRSNDAAYMSTPPLAHSLSFAAFIRMALVAMRSSSDCAKELDVPLGFFGRRRADACFNELRQIVHSGKIDFRQAVTLASVLGTPQWICDKLCAERFQAVLTQMAWHFQPLCAQQPQQVGAAASEYASKDAVWRWERCFPVTQERVAELCKSSFNQQIPVREALLVPMQSLCLRELLGNVLRDLTGFNEPTALDKQLRAHAQFFDVCHPMHTNGEMWSLISVDTLLTVPSLRAYLLAAATTSSYGSEQFDDLGIACEYTGAIVRGDASLFHWVNAWRAAMALRFRSKHDARAAPPLDMELASDPGDDSAADDGAPEDELPDDEEDFMSPFFSHWRLLTRAVHLESAHLRERARIVFDGSMIPRLLREASGTEESQVNKVVDRVHWLASVHYVVSVALFRWICDSVEGFAHQFEILHSELFNKLKAALAHNPDAYADCFATGDLRAYICRDELHVLPDGVPEYLPLKPSLSLLVFRRIRELLGIGGESAQLALRLFFALRAMSIVKEAKVVRSLPLLFKRASNPLKGIALWDRMRDAAFHAPVSAALSDVQQGVAVAAVAACFDAFGMRCAPNAEEDKAALELLAPLVVQGSLIINKRSHWALLLPVHAQHPMYVHEQLTHSVALVTREITAGNWEGGPSGGGPPRSLLTNTAHLQKPLAKRSSSDDSDTISKRARHVAQPAAAAATSAVASAPSASPAAPTARSITPPPQQIPTVAAGQMSLAGINLTELYGQIQQVRKTEQMNQQLVLDGDCYSPTHATQCYTGTASHVSADTPVRVRPGSPMYSQDQDPIEAAAAAGHSGPAVSVNDDDFRHFMHEPSRSQPVQRHPHQQHSRPPYSQPVHHTKSRWEPSYPTPAQNYYRQQLDNGDYKGNSRTQNRSKQRW